MDDLIKRLRKGCPVESGWLGRDAEMNGEVDKYAADAMMKEAATAIEHMINQLKEKV